MACPLLFLPPLQALAAAFTVERDLVAQIAAARGGAPDAATLQALAQTLAGPAGAAIALSEGQRGPFYLHQKAVAEAVPALYWVVYAGPASGMNAPPSHVADTWQAAEFFVNKVRVPGGVVLLLSPPFPPFLPPAATGAAGGRASFSSCLEQGKDHPA